MQVDAENRGTGEAYVEFVRPDDAEKALYKNRQMMGHRYCACVCACVRACVCACVCVLHCPLYWYRLFMDISELLELGM